MMTAIPHQRGFTLLELLIASIVFAIMALMAYGGLDNVIDISQSSKAALERLRQVQQGVTIISRDFNQLADRSIRDEFGTLQAPLMAGNDADKLVELTRGGHANPAGLRRSTLQRVAYRFEEDKLVRLTWPNLDRAQAEEPRETELLDEVEEVTIRFLDDQAQWQEQWPPLNFDLSASQAGLAAIPSPLAIEIVVNLKDWGDIRRVYAVPAAVNQQGQQGLTPGS